MIRIPDRFQAKLEENKNCDAAVKKTISNASVILEDNRMEFFPDYTNHGIKHISAVVDIAAQIMDEETYNNLSAVDMEVLIGAIMIHDIGMHITFAGFKELISRKEIEKGNFYGDLSWHDLWEEYMDEAYKWDDAKKEDVFGGPVEIERIPEDEKYINKAHRLLIGEFLRRHHARLSFEIAIHGFPGVEKNVPLLETSDIELKALIGHVARSHGMNLWEMTNFLKQHYDAVREISGVKIVYIMAVLRIADYFDIDKTRANPLIWNIKKIDSRLSKEEWEKHSYIDSISFNYNEDKETIYIRIKEPKTSYMFLRIESFLQELQKEVDTTWAVIGHFYSRYDHFGLSFRRVCSNLDWIKAHVSYITEKVCIDVNKNILAHLSQPLYGSNPSYGIRELLQNATDACREKSFLADNTYQPLVVLEIKREQDKKWFIITDNGTGMDKDIIIKHFLVAGSSFRNDNEWKKKYTSDNGEVVVRNGKFGIGVIAAFLLGNTILVETIPMNKGVGFKFKASLADRQIELLNEKTGPKASGTTIKIELEDVVYELLKKQWEGNWERGHYHYSGKEVPWHEWYKETDIQIDIVVPEDWKSKKGNSESRKWNYFDVAGYELVKWSYDKLPSAYRLICNGIVIPNGYQIKGYDFPFNMKVPLLSLIDKTGNLKIDLSRRGIEKNRVSFEQELMKEIYTDILNELEAQQNLSRLSVDSLVVRNSVLKHPSLDHTSYWSSAGMHVHELIFNKLGYCLCYDYCLQNMNDNVLTKIWTEEDLEIKNNNLLSLLGENIVICRRETPNSIDSYKTCLDMNSGQGLGEKYSFNAKWILMRKNKYEYLFDADKNRLRMGFVEEIEKVSQNDTWVFLRRKGETIEVNIDSMGDLSQISLMVQYFYVKEDKEVRFNQRNQLLNSVLEERYGKNVFIPYSD